MDRVALQRHKEAGKKCSGGTGSDRKHEEIYKHLCQFKHSLMVTFPANMQGCVWVRVFYLLFKPGDMSGDDQCPLWHIFLKKENDFCHIYT